MTLFHLATQAEWAQARAGDRYAPASLVAEGFVHCSADRAGLERVARKLTGPLLIIELDEAALDVEVRWETARDGQRYPHVHGSVPLAAVRKITPR